MFIFFVALAALAWYIRALGDNYHANIKYPIKYLNLPPNIVLHEEPSGNLNILISTDGLTILRNKLKLKTPLYFDFNDFIIQSNNSNLIRYYILTRFSYEKLSTSFIDPNKNLQVIKVSPDTLFLIFSDSKTKRLPVNLRIKESNTLFTYHHKVNDDIDTSLIDSADVPGSCKVSYSLSLKDNKDIAPINNFVGNIRVAPEGKEYLIAKK